MGTSCWQECTGVAEYELGFELLYTLSTCQVVCWRHRLGSWERHGVKQSEQLLQKWLKY
jgi:hypothetical protein